MQRKRGGVKAVSPAGDAAPHMQDLQLHVEGDVSFFVSRPRVVCKGPMSTLSPAVIAAYKDVSLVHLVPKLRCYPVATTHLQRAKPVSTEYIGKGSMVDTRDPEGMIQEVC